MPGARSTSPTDPEETAGRPPGNRWPFAHALLFTGHMIDTAGRRHPRFPEWAQNRARKAIHAAIAGVEWPHPGATVGLAGGASGGDLLFHECCRELGIPTRVLLALPPDEFEAESVAPAGPGWVKRFHTLLEWSGNALEIMQRNDGQLEGASDNIWQRANLWMIEEANRLARERALLALWDGKVGDGPGGTEHFLQAARKSGIRVLPPIEMQTVLQMDDTPG
jgi:hypothetical protein